MLNQVVLVGRLTKEVELKELENDKKVASITIACPRSYKNEKGEYDTDFIECKLWNMVAGNTKEYCHKGDILGVKGRIQSDGNKMEIIAEKVTFLSSKKEGEE